MQRVSCFLSHLLVCLLCLCVLMLALWLPLRSALQFRIADTTVSLETSRQRETKQTYEYRQVTEALPLARAELEALQPQADEAIALDRDLRAQRKALRAEIKALQEALEALQEEAP